MLRKLHERVKTVNWDKTRKLYTVAVIIYIAVYLTGVLAHNPWWLPVISVLGGAFAGVTGRVWWLYHRNPRQKMYALMVVNLGGTYIYLPEPRRRTLTLQCPRCGHRTWKTRSWASKDYHRYAAHYVDHLAAPSETIPS